MNRSKFIHHTQISVLVAYTERKTTKISHRNKWKCLSARTYSFSFGDVKITAIDGISNAVERYAYERFKLAEWLNYSNESMSNADE